MSDPRDEIELDVVYVDQDNEDWGKDQSTYDDYEEEIDWEDY